MAHMCAVSEALREQGAWWPVPHTLYAEQQKRQVVIKSAVIPSMNRSRLGLLWWKLSMSNAASREKRRDSGKRREMVFDARPLRLFSIVAGPHFWADVLTVSGSMEGEIPTKGGVQILWEIRSLFNISWSPTIYSWDFIPLEGPIFSLTPPPQWAALNWVPAHSPAPWQIVPDEKPLPLQPPPLLPKSGKQKEVRALLVVRTGGSTGGMDEKW